MRSNPIMRRFLLPRVSLAPCCGAAAVAACLLFGLGTAIANPVFVFLGEDYFGRSPKNAAVSPTFQYTYEGVIYHPGEGPWANYPPEDIELRIVAPCANPVVLHPDGPSGPDGLVTWGVDALDQGGGSCAGPSVLQVWMTDFELVFELGYVRSPDQDGDGFVALVDLVPWQQAFVNQQPSYIGDLDRDNVIGLSDLLFWQRHFVAE